MVTVDTFPTDNGEDSTTIISSYLAQVSAIDALEPGEEARLLQGARQGDRAARQALVRAHLPLVVELASGHRGRGVRFLDLVQEGNMALLQAIDAADVPLSGFCSHARRRVEEALADALRACPHEAVMPAELVRFLAMLQRARDILTRRLDRPPAPQELADKMKMTLDQFLGLQEQVEEMLGRDR